MRAESPTKRCSSGRTARALLAALQVFACANRSIALPLGGAEQKHGKVFYLDGAGGGGPITDWGRGVREGLERAGVGLEFMNFRWQTGLGAGADQLASVEYKRGQAKKLAAEIARFHKDQPDAPIHLIGLSAGTAVAVFTLEALPEDCTVETVTLLSSSLSADYDIGPALRHVRFRMNVFTSDKDALLKTLVPATGSADRVYCGTRLVGLIGFQRPVATKGERRLGKVVTIPWREKFALNGNAGGHTDFAEPRFVQADVAPLLVTQSDLLARASNTSNAANRMAR